MSHSVPPVVLHAYCPECDATTFCLPGLPGGPALCGHPTAGYRFTRYIQAAELERERQDAWEALDGTHVKALMEDLTDAEKEISHLRRELADHERETGFESYG